MDFSSRTRHSSCSRHLAYLAFLGDLRAQGAGLRTPKELCTRVGFVIVGLPALAMKWQRCMHAPLAAWRPLGGGTDDQRRSWGTAEAFTATPGRSPPSLKRRSAARASTHVTSCGIYSCTLCIQSRRRIFECSLCAWFCKICTVWLRPSWAA